MLARPAPPPPRPSPEASGRIRRLLLPELRQQLAELTARHDAQLRIAIRRVIEAYLRKAEQDRGPERNEPPEPPPAPRPRQGRRH